MPQDLHSSTGASILFPFFFSLLPPPPGSTLFPYTTLFRSRRQAPPPRHLLDPIHQLAGLLALGDFLPDHPRDRKSTRLNSSHVSTSYAVFCLKKKPGPMSIPHTACAHPAPAPLTTIPHSLP